MKKPFLLIAGFSYYPGFGTEDWKGCYGTIEEAQNKVVMTDKMYCILNGKNKMYYIINGKKYDWYNIVDLREWAE